jgi:chitinase
MKTQFNLSRIPLFIMLMVACLFNDVSKAQEGKQFAVIAYYMDGADEVDNYQVEKLTHIIYSFLHLEGSVLKVNPEDSISITHLVSLKKRNPRLKIIVSLGGWGGCPTCPAVFSTEEGRSEFSNSVRTILEHYGADGLDLDWEYPGLASVPGFEFSPADRPNFTLLVKKIREVLGKEYELSFAAGGFKDFFIYSVEWDKVMQYVNYVNLMTYDIVNGYSNQTGHHTPLFSTSRQEGSVDFTVRYLDSIGVPRNKLVIGAAFYARVYKNVADTNYGLYQSCEFSDYVNFKDFNTYFAKGSGFINLWDSEAEAPYSYNKGKRLFATYDDKHSVALKTQYIMRKKLGGIMFWSLNGDNYKDGLLQIIDDTIRHGGE